MNFILLQVYLIDNKTAHIFLLCTYYDEYTSQFSLKIKGINLACHQTQSFVTVFMKPRIRIIYICDIHLDRLFIPGGKYWVRNVWVRIVLNPPKINGDMNRNCRTCKEIYLQHIF